MLRINRYCLRIAAMIAGSAVIALPAAAIDPEHVWKVCEDFVRNHIDEPKWEKACYDAMAELESQRPPVLSTAQTPPTPVISSALAVSAPASSDGDRDSILQILRSGESADIIIEFEARNVRVEAHSRAIDKRLLALSADELAYKRSGYASVKQDGLTGLQGVTVLRDYENLATSFARVSNEAALNSILARPEVRAVHENKALRYSLSESLPLIEQPAAAALGWGGAGTTIAVLDTGVDYTVSPFNCTSPGIPAGCRVVATFEAAADDFSLDDDGHGTNVSAIAASTAADADIVVADVFDGLAAYNSDIFAAIDWAITNQATFNIVAMNLSVGDDAIHVTPCTTNPFATPLADALAAGIQPVVASGNTAFYYDSFYDGIASPACVPAAVSVGAVYDANVGPITWGPFPYQCTNSTTAADQVTCFSQTAPILSLLAPGLWITAGGPTWGGTSQAAPHVAGAWAVVSATLPSGTDAALILAALQAGGDPITDPRPSGGRTTSRINFVPEPGQYLMLGSGILALIGMSFLRKRSS